MEKGVNKDVKNKKDEKQEFPVGETLTKKNNKGIIIGGVICAVCIVGILYYFKIYDGGFPVTQVINTYELGSEQDILDSLKYDERKIVDVSIVNRGGFTIDKTGSYTVTFDFINRRKNHKQIPYTYKVEDTIAPELTVEKSEIYVAKGHEFKLDMYASSTDISHTNVIKYDEEFDVNTPGTYELNVYAEDESGNKSTAQPVKIIVEDRDNCDINMANFGDSKEIVKRYETHENVEETDGVVNYRIEENGITGNLFYNFNQNGQLCGVTYLFSTDYQLDEYINKYDLFKQGIIEKYGSPSYSDLKYDKTYSPVTALWLGRYVQYDKWQLDNMEIKSYLMNINEDIILAIYYDSKEYPADETN